MIQNLKYLTGMPGYGLPALVLAAMLIATPIQAQNRPQPQPQPQQAPPQLSSIQQVCRLREQDIIALNRSILERNQAASRETDQARRNGLISTIPQIRQNLRETEESWYRLDCAQIIYGAKSSGNR